MSDLRKAAEMALVSLESIGMPTQSVRQSTEALRQALAQPEQEFVGACVTCGAPKGEWLVDAVNMSQERVDETAKREHEPIGYINGVHGGYMVFTPSNPSAVYLNGTALFLAPPKKEWVGLTDNEIWDLGANNKLDVEWAYEIETKLKEKNA